MKVHTPVRKGLAV